MTTPRHDAEYDVALWYVACAPLNHQQWEAARDSLDGFHASLYDSGFCLKGYYDNNTAGYEVITYMPKKSENSKRAPWKGFVNINLAKSDKAALEKFADSYENNLEEPMHKLLNDGITLSIKWLDKDACYMASMRCDDPESPNGGYCVTSRSRDFVEAYWMSLYKHFEICDGDWTTQLVDSDDSFQWG
jgi:hypothetical protein